MIEHPVLRTTLALLSTILITWNISAVQNHSMQNKRAETAEELYEQAQRYSKAKECTKALDKFLLMSPTGRK
jgi:outer membrane protein assembly factor BamD (BamD/ComL family)